MTGHLNPEDEGNILLRNIGSYLSADTAGTQQKTSLFIRTAKALNVAQCNIHFLL